MITIGDIIFLRPLWALVLPAVVLFAVLSLRRSTRPGDWQARIEPHLMATLTALGRVESGRSGWMTALPFLVAGLIVIALIGPAIEQRSAQTFRNLDGVVFVVDVSGSMTQDDSWPAVITMARAGLSVLGSKPAALVVYAGDSYRAVPLTTDHMQLGQTVSVLDADTVPDPGNRPALALSQAGDMLEEAQILAGDVVLLSDGAGVGPAALREAERITRLGARLSVVIAKTSVANGGAGDPVALETLARVGGGSVYGVDDVTLFMDDLGRADSRRLERQDLQLLLLTDFGRYLLVLALIPALLFFRRDKV